MWDFKFHPKAESNIFTKRMDNQLMNSKTTDLAKFCRQMWYCVCPYFGLYRRLPVNDHWVRPTVWTRCEPDNKLSVWMDHHSSISWRTRQHWNSEKVMDSSTIYLGQDEKTFMLNLWRDRLDYIEGVVGSCILVKTYNQCAGLICWCLTVLGSVAAGSWLDLLLHVGGRTMITA